MAHGENARAELINLFRAYFHDNTNGLRKVEEFERDYRPEDAILWYTKESFIYTTLNKALRIQDISTLHKMRCFIADIHHQLDYLCRQSNYTSNFEVYRGQCMSTHDFQKHSRNVGGLISFNSLLSCSEDHRVALLYANSQDRNDSIVPVLLHIIVNPGVRNTAFSNIIAVSGFGDIEQEFLFSMGAIFRILSIQRLLIEMGDLNQSERFYKIVLREAYANHDPRIIAWIYNDLGFIASQNGFKEKGLQFYKKALRIGQERFPLQDPQLAPILNNIGEFYFDSEDFDKADEYYRKALEIDMKSTAPALYNQAIRYQNIGMVYNEKQNYKDAQKNFKKSLDKKMSILPQKHPSIAITHRSISGVYCSQGRFTEALQHCQAALAIERSSLPPYHVSLSKTHQCMARIYLGQEQFMNAQKEIVEALDIAKKTLPEQHKIILAIKDDMDHLLTMLKFGANLPDVLFYNNACELRLNWNKVYDTKYLAQNEFTNKLYNLLLVLDRFHRKGHTRTMCRKMVNPDDDRYANILPEVQAANLSLQSEYIGGVNLHNIITSLIRKLNNCLQDDVFGCKVG
ncbi:unnamed protein product [Rotaria socialis]|uniref:Uncharacterized protein n=1 Tax=Rotaria socialis TaxID=392032 RepID=A0A820YRW9_9BILA|nr:unnamed protein product [Rotaria socialis]